MLQPVLKFSFRAVMSCNNNLGGPLLTAPLTENVAQLTCDRFEMQLLCTVELFFLVKAVNPSNNPVTLRLTEIINNVVTPENSGNK